MSNLASPYIRSIGADLVWNGTPNIQGDGVTVAVVDRGIAANSADLKTGDRDTYNIKVVNLSLNSTVAESYHTSAMMLWLLTQPLA